MANQAANGGQCGSGRRSHDVQPREENQEAQKKSDRDDDDEAEQEHANRIWAMVAATNSTSLNPRTLATNAMTRKMNAHLNITPDSTL